MSGTFALVREMLAQDPAYRPAHPLEQRDRPDVVIDY
jgi:hypothetical protein